MIIKNKHKIYITSIITITILSVINKLTSVSCPQIDIFKGDSLFLFLKSFVYFILGISIWIIGYKLYKRLNLDKIQLIVYFIFITLISTSNIIKKIWVNNFSQSSKLIELICFKSDDDGMMFKANRLNVKEYNYLIEGSGWLPIMPTIAKNIDIIYYRDEFLGDYSLNIEIQIPENKSIDSIKHPKWKFKKDNIYVFSSGAD